RGRSADGHRPSGMARQQNAAPAVHARVALRVPLSEGDSRLLTAVAAAFGIGGLLYFISATNLGSSSLAGTALGLIGLAVLVYLVRTVDPAWLFSAGIAASMFGGHWNLLGIYTNPGPHRIVLIAALIGVLFKIGPSRDRPPLTLGSAHFVMAVAVAYATVSALVSGTLSDIYSQSNLLDVFGAVPFAMFAVAPVVFTTRRQRTILLGTLVGAGAYLVLTALLEKFKVNPLIWPNYIKDPGMGAHFGRARGPFVD